MKFTDTTITALRKRKELMIFGVCFLVAYLLNVIGIVQYKSPARELVTQLHVVLLISLVFYGMIVMLRILYHFISRWWVRK